MDQQQPPFQQTPDPFQSYNPPPPKKASRTWLYILLGVLGLCVVCGIIGIIAYNVLSPSVSEVMQQVQATVEVQLQPTQASLPSSQNPASGQDFVGGNPSITGVTLARNVSGEELSPVDPTTVFGAADTFHAVTAIVDAPENTRFRAAWYAVDVGDAAAPNTLIDGNELVASGTRNLDFSLSPANNWPSGTYRVEIYVNDVLDRVLNFSVQ